MTTLYRRTSEMYRRQFTPALYMRNQSYEIATPQPSSHQLVTHGEGKNP